MLSTATVTLDKCPIVATKINVIGQFEIQYYMCMIIYNINEKRLEGIVYLFMLSSLSSQLLPSFVALIIRT